MILNSIRWRLQVWHGLILTVIVIGFSITAYQLEYAQRLRRIDNELQELTSQLTAIVRPTPEGGPRQPPSRRPDGPGRDGPGRDGPGRDGPGFDRPPEPPRFDRPPGSSPPDDRSPPDVGERVPEKIAALFDDTKTNAYYYAVWVSDGTLQKRSTNAAANLTMPERLGTTSRQSARSRGTLREVFRFTTSDRCVLVGRSIATELAELHHLGWWLALAAGAVLLLGLAGGWWVSTQAIRPIKDISATADRIASGDLSQRINAAQTKNELGQLAHTLNSTFARLEGAFARQRQFTADASHELRTPIAVLISEAQTSLARKRSAEEYRETIEACLETAQQMRQLTEALLELARLDAGQAPSNRVPLNLADVVRTCIEQIHPLADERGIRINANLSPAHTVGHTVQLSQVITNLLANAIHYNRPNGEIHVSTCDETGRLVLLVTDTGAGIALEDLPHIFERFYRADKARTRTEGRTGLGLAICKAIITAHDGTIDVKSTPGTGSTFKVTLPGGSAGL